MARVGRHVSLPEAVAAVNRRAIDLAREKDLQIGIIPRKDMYHSEFVYDPTDTVEEMKHNSSVNIGLRALFESASKFPWSGKVRDDVFVLSVFQTDHEFVHTDQHFDKFASKNPSEETEAMARSMVVAAADPAYTEDDSQYLSMPSEYEANLYAAITTEQYFREKYPEIEAGKIIAEKLSSYSEMYPYGKTDDFDAVVNHMMEHKDEVAHQKRSIDLTYGSDVTKSFIHDSEFRREYQNALSDGAAADKVVVERIRRDAPEYLNPYPCLKEKSGGREIKKSRGEMAEERFGHILEDSDLNRDAGNDIEYGDD